MPNEMRYPEVAPQSVCHRGNGPGSAIGSTSLSPSRRAIGSTQVGGGGAVVPAGGVAGGQVGYEMQFSTLHPQREPSADGAISNWPASTSRLGTSTEHIERTPHTSSRNESTAVSVPSWNG